MTVYFDFDDLTDKEKEAVKQIDKAMKVLSKRYWFFAAGGDFDIMRYKEGRERGLCNYAGNHTGMDQDMVAAKIMGHEVDGGDW